MLEGELLPAAMICLPLSWAPWVSSAEAQAPCQFICCTGDGACTVRPVKIQYLSSREAPSPVSEQPRHRPPTSRSSLQGPSSHEG